MYCKNFATTGLFSAFLIQSSSKTVVSRASFEFTTLELNWNVLSSSTSCNAFSNWFECPRIGSKTTLFEFDKQKYLLLCWLNLNLNFITG